jgi:hypothetical protein
VGLCDTKKIERYNTSKNDMGEKYGDKQFHIHLLVMEIEEARSAKLVQLVYWQA